MFLDDIWIFWSHDAVLIAVYFSKRSRAQLKAQVLMNHHLLPSPDPSLVSNAAPTKSRACWRILNGVVPVLPKGSWQGRVLGGRVELAPLPLDPGRT